MDIFGKIGALIAGHIKSLNDRVTTLEGAGTGFIDGGTAVIIEGTFTELDGGSADL